MAPTARAMAAPDTAALASYETVVEMCLAGDAGDAQDAAEFCRSFRQTLRITDAAHSLVLTKKGADGFWRAALGAVKAQEAEARDGRGAGWLLERQRRQDADREGRRALLEAAECGDLETLRRVLVESEALGLAGFGWAGCPEAEAAQASQAAALAKAAEAEREQAHLDKFGYDYGPRNNFSALMFNVRANAKTVSAYEEAPPPAPAPAPFVHPDWSDSETEEAEEAAAPTPAPSFASAPKDDEAAAAEAAAAREAAARDAARRRVALIADDDAWLEALDHAAAARTDAVGAARGHAVDAAACFRDGVLDAWRMPRVKFEPGAAALRSAEARSVLRDDVAPALAAAGAACSAHGLPFLATVRVFVRGGPCEELSRRKNLQADALAHARAEAVVDALVAAGVPRDRVAAGVGGAAVASAVEIDLAVAYGDDATDEGWTAAQRRADVLALLEGEENDGW